MGWLRHKRSRVQRTGGRRSIAIAGAVALICGVSPVAMADYVVEPATEPVAYPGWDRFSLIYSPEILLSHSSLPALNGGTQSTGPGTTEQNIGLELSSRTGRLMRYHGQLAYSNINGVSGISLNPFGFGWAIPLARGRNVGVELEPILSLLDASLFFTTDQTGGNNVSFLLGSGAALQANFFLDSFYAFVAPIGIEVRYLEVTSGTGGKATGGADPYWLFRLGVGIQY